MNSIKHFDTIISNIYIPTEEGFYVPKIRKWNLKMENITELNPNICAENFYRFLKDLLLESDIFNSVQNFSKPEGGDFCFNLQLIKDDFKNSFSHSICINISHLIPYFHLHVLKLYRKKDNFSKWEGYPKRKKIRD